jgi:hypothetical protein
VSCIRGVWRQPIRLFPWCQSRSKWNKFEFKKLN